MAVASGTVGQFLARTLFMQIKGGGTNIMMQMCKMNTSMESASIVLDCDWISNSCMLATSFAAGVKMDTLSVPHRSLSFQFP